jgi:hypothetical protein
MMGERVWVTNPEWPSYGEQCTIHCTIQDGDTQKYILNFGERYYPIALTEQELKDNTGMVH